MPSVELACEPSHTENSQTRLVYRVDVLPLSIDLADRVTLPAWGDLITHPVYWFRVDTPCEEIIEKLATEALIDPILQTFTISKNTQPAGVTLALSPQTICLEKQFLPGVTDNLAKTVASTLKILFKNQPTQGIQVASGEMMYIESSETPTPDWLKQFEYGLFNPLVQSLRAYPINQASSNNSRYYFPQVIAGAPKPVETMCLDISDTELMEISRSGNLALTLDEMKVIQSYFSDPEVQHKRAQKGLGQWPTDVELEIIAQTWSEHCKHKIFAAQITYTDATIPDWPETTVIDSLFRTYIAGSTHKLLPKRPDLLSIFKDNAGVLRWNDQVGVCFKVETHNSPSALEPYGGALTGIVGVNRDILGTGLGAKPLFNTDVFCFAHPNEPYASRPTMLPPESILQGVRKGVEDGGNKSGIPTVNGALFFDARYRAKPLVFCGTGGLLPLKIGDKLGYEKYTQPGDTIVMAGGRVGKDGIHGATFSSEALNQDSPVSAVQIGDPLTQKRLSDFMLVARDRGLLSGLTDNGAGGLSSSVGEMAQITNGASIHLDKVPLKYPGLAAYEIVISESQERMTFSTNQYEALETLANQYDVEISNIGTFHTEGSFDAYHNGQLVASLDLAFLHDGLPQMQLQAKWVPKKTKSIRAELPSDMNTVLLKLLASPNICSREALIRQYDHEVQGRSVIKPLMGKNANAPCDAAVIQPILGEPEGLVISNGLCPQFSDWDPYAMAACALDEAVRNAVAVGADPKSIAILDNFCWPDPLPSVRNEDAEHKLAQLVRACQALHDLSLAYETPLISGKDSMKNDFDDGEFRLSIPPTLLVSAIGKIPDFTKAVSMEFKAPEDHVFLLGKTNVHLGGAQYYQQMGWYSPYCPKVNVPLAQKLYTQLYQCIQNGWIQSCHDLSEGGLGIALAEASLGSGYGINADLQEIIHDSPELRWDEALFSESPSRFVISVSPHHIEVVKQAFADLPILPLGPVTEEAAFKVHIDDNPPVIDLPVNALLQAWRTPPAQCYAQGVTP